MGHGVHASQATTDTIEAKFWARLDELKLWLAYHGGGGTEASIYLPKRGEARGIAWCLAAMTGYTIEDIHNMYDREGGRRA
jgi:hypothetical protein